MDIFQFTDFSFGCYLSVCYVLSCALASFRSCYDMAHREESGAKKDTFWHIHRMSDSEYISFYLQCSGTGNLQYSTKKYRLSNKRAIPTPELLSLFLCYMCRKHGLKFPENPCFWNRHAPVLFCRSFAVSRDAIFGLVLLCGYFKCDYLYPYERSAKACCELDSSSALF